MRILITGDRRWQLGNTQNFEAVMDPIQKRSAIRGPTADIYIIGGAGGVDQIAEKCCYDLGIHAAIVNAHWPKYGRSAGPQRNAAMLMLQPDMVWWFHPDLANSKGTKDCVKKAKALGILCVKEGMFIAEEDRELAKRLQGD